MIDRTLFVQQSDEAIAAGAFHNDVVAVANERTLFAHELAFADRDVYEADPAFYAPPSGLLDPDYLRARSALIRADSSMKFAASPTTEAGTVI